MRTRNLNSFIKVATLGSFHAVASQLHTSQPAISARIAMLKEELGVRLFKRDQSGTQFTTCGIQLLPYAERLVSITNERKAPLKKKAREKGIFCIGIADTVAHLWLTELLKVWREKQPMIRFGLTIGLSQSLYKKRQENHFDLALMAYRGQGAINTQPLCAYLQSWVVTLEFAAQHAVAFIHDLALLSILSSPINTGPGRHLQQLFQDQTDMPKLHTSNSVACLLAMAEQGAGASLLVNRSFGTASHCRWLCTEILRTSRSPLMPATTLL